MILKHPTGPKLLDEMRGNEMMSNERMKCRFYGCEENRMEPSVWCEVHLMRHPKFLPMLSPLRKAVAGAIKSHIDAHGASLIDSHIGSLQKRIIGAVIATLDEHPIGSGTDSTQRSELLNGQERSAKDNSHLRKDVSHD